MTGVARPVDGVPSDMGLHTEVVRALRVEMRGTGAFSPKHPETLRAVHIVDLYPAVFAAMRRDPATNMFVDTFTGEQLYDHIMHRFRSKFLAQSAKVLVLCCDKGTPELKLKTVEKRKQQAEKQKKTGKMKQYRDECEIGDLGIKNGEYSNWEPLSARALMQTRNARSKLWDYFFLKLSNDRSIGHGISVIFDCYKEGGYHFPGGKLLEGTAHEYLESDLSMYYWAQRLHAFAGPTILETIDSDTLPILFHFVASNVETIQSAGRIFVKRKNRQRGTEYLDGWLYTERMLTKLNFGPLEFMVACVLGGTDFHEKNNLFKGLGWEILYYSVSQCKDHAAQILESWVHLEWIVRFAWTYRLDGEYTQRSRWKKLSKTAQDKVRRKLRNGEDLEKGEVEPVEEFELPVDNSNVDGARYAKEPYTIKRLREICEERKFTSLLVPKSSEIAKEWRSVCANLRYWLIDFSALPNEPAKQSKLTREAVRARQIELAGGKAQRVTGEKYGFR